MLRGMWITLSSLVILGEEHFKRLKEVLFQLKQANLTVDISKSNFVKVKVIYLGIEL